MGLRDSLRFTAAAVGHRLRRALRGASVPPPQALARLDLDALRFPDTALVTRSFAFCEEAYEPWLMNHCLRSYLWGGLVGQLEQVAVDREELLVAALVHDLGLAERFKRRPDFPCFAVRGAEAAAAFLEKEGAPGRAPAVRDAVAMHLGIAVSRGQPPLNYLLHQGVSIDVVGWNAAKVGPARERVLHDHPRLDFKDRLSDAMAREARERPGTRLSLMIRFGFLDFIRGAPYTE